MSKGTKHNFTPREDDLILKSRGRLKELAYEFDVSYGSIFARRQRLCNPLRADEYKRPVTRNHADLPIPFSRPMWFDEKPPAELARRNR